MNKHYYKDLVIEVFDEPVYKFDSSDNNSNYLRHHFGEGGRDYPTSKHGIKVFQNDQEINNCIVIGSGGATGIYNGSSIIDQDQLVICCCDTVFCLTIPDLELRWQIRADSVTCFGVYKLQDDYIVHGELEVSRIDRDGNIKWQFGGSDIFVSLDEEDAFKLNADHIALTDFCKIKYKLDFDGKTI